MNYKESLFFIGNCLTISHDENNLKVVTRKIKSEQINWDIIVKTSTQQYVLPALYCSLLRAKLLSYLPKELVSFMKYITDLNRDRNLQIIEQAKEISTLLKFSNITPTFLKGTGFLVQGIYEDIAERMVGDIDFIVSKKHYEKTIEILKKFGYSKVHKTSYDFPSFKHYPRLQKDNRIAAIEIHKELIKEEYVKEFSTKSVLQNPIKMNGYCTMDYHNQLSLAIIAYQINDNGQYFNAISLRNGYDVFLLSKKVNPLKVIHNFDVLFHPLNNFLAICNTVFSTSIPYKKTENSEQFINTFFRIMSDQKFQKSHFEKWKRRLFIKARINVISKSFYRKEYRYWLFKKITDKQWHKQKMMPVKYLFKKK